MNERKSKQLRKYLKNHLAEVMIMLRNEFGAMTEKMGPRSIYQNTKKLYYRGKIKII